MARKEPSVRTTPNPSRKWTLVDLAATLTGSVQPLPHGRLTNAKMVRKLGRRPPVPMEEHHQNPLFLT